MKYVVVCGSVMSGLGKGVITSSMGVILKSMGFSVTAIKIDPYLNVDAGTINPYDHGETYVLESGAEVDLDLGNYERFLDVTLTPDHNLTTGKIYQKVIGEERKGSYLGKTVQVVPHLTDSIQKWIKNTSHIIVDRKGEPEVCLIELGGTVGDIESAPFIEALRQFQYSIGKDNFFLVNVSYVPFLNEHKTKPTQAAIRDLRGLGLIPDVVVCRSGDIISDSVREKIALFCHLPLETVFVAPDVDNIYKVPFILEKQSMVSILCKSLKLEKCDSGKEFYSRWKNLFLSDPKKKTKIGIVGKYTNLPDCYYSLIQALKFSSWEINVDLEVLWIESSDWGSDYSPPKMDGMIVPGGFGERGIEGMINAITHARINKIPYFGICLGMQLAIVEYSRKILMLGSANSEEFDDRTIYPVIKYMPDVDRETMGATMRLGVRETHLECGRVSDIYEKRVILERHRHRYEVNPDYRDFLQKNGLIFSGKDVFGERMEVIELPSDVHPFFIGVQFHPEYNSHPFRPHPLFSEFIKEASDEKILDTSGAFLEINEVPKLF